MRSLLLLVCLAASAQTPPPSCESTDHHRLDFWLGEWAVYSGKQKIGLNRIESSLRGCLIIERWQGADGDQGVSFNWFDRVANKWRQVYSGPGWHVEYMGEWTGSELMFTGKQDQGDVRLTLTPVANSVRQHKERFSAGKWSTIYDFRYEKAAASHPAEDAGTKCSGEARQFDFWHGQWDVYTPDRQLAGSNRIESLVNGCLAMENWRGSKGYEGKSLNFYDRSAGRWRQFWVAPGGWLNLSGEWKDGRMQLTGKTPGQSGAIVEERITFTPEADGTVRQFWQQSRDGGKSWTTAFDGRYVRKQ